MRVDEEHPPRELVEMGAESPDPLTTRLLRHVRAGVRVLALVTDEEDRALEHLEDLARELGWPLHLWSATTGLDETGAERDLGELLRRLRGHDPGRTPGGARPPNQASLFALLDPGPQLSSPIAQRLLREVAQRLGGPVLVCIGTTFTAAAQAPEIVLESLPPPDAAELEATVRRAASDLPQLGASPTQDLRAIAPTLARLGLGLSRQAFERLLAEALLEHGLDAPKVLGHLAKRKAETIDRTGLLDVVTAAPAESLGGVRRLRAFVTKRALAFSPAAREAAIPYPRGILLVGVQGCGKSLAARAMGSLLDLPVLRLEPGRLFGGTVGESEANLRRLTVTADRLAPFVLWIDEVDKGLSGFEASAADAGTSARVVGGLLTWLQERTAPVFVVATANRIDRLPAEFLRRGRLDEIFFVDLPNPEERAEILKIHLEDEPRRSLGYVPPYAGTLGDYTRLSATAEGYSGAELAAALVEARLEAFAEARLITPQDLEAALRATVPLSHVRAEEVAALRQWAKTRARMA